MSKFALTILFWLFGLVAFCQCNLLSTSISVDFSANGTCAPVTVNTFDVTYTFNAAQTPADVTIRFIWNDPANTTEDIGLGSGLVVTNTDRTYQAVASVFPYPATGNDCFYEAQAFIIVNGDICETSEQTQVVPSWNTDDENGGVIAMDPAAFNVCEDNAIVSAVFADASTFNCNINDNPDNPNQISRHTQFVYGTNYTAGDIRDITIDDGGAQTVTDNNGILSSPETRGTGAIMVTGGYFGPIEEVPFPADNPIHNSLPLSAPANPLNAVGSTFEVTLFNWNTCSPYNGDAANPNYEDAVSQTVNVTIIAPPAPSFSTVGGPEFCINEDIVFNNETAGGPYTYLWQFYDDDLGTTLLGTDNAVNPTFQFANGGDKLVRLTASDGGADGDCDVIFEDIVTLSPDAVADFEFTDVGFGVDPSFCQTGADVFTIGFQDNTTIVANTEVRYEFYVEGNPPTSGTPSFTEPTSGVFQTTNIAPFDLDFSNEEYVIAQYVARNTSSLCSSFERDTIFVYGRPLPQFNTNEVCEGERTSFSNLTDQLTGFSTRVNDDIIDQYEWDFSYDGATFNTELVRNDDTDFDWFLDGDDNTLNVEPGSSVAATHTVALRLTSQKGGCVSEVLTADVIVHPNPDAQLAYDVTGSLCPGDPIVFTNNSSNVGITTNYVLEVSNILGFASSTTLISTDTTLSFGNTEATTLTYDAVIRAVTDVGCETLSTVLQFDVSPDEDSNFDDPNYEFFNTNCSPWNSTLEVDQATQDLLADSYTWTISDTDGVLAGYPITKNSGDADFDILDYSLDNTSGTIITYEAVLEVTKAGVCVANDTFNLQISPQPDADFTMNRVEDCEEVVFELEATQKGLPTYDWVFNPLPDNDFGAGDQRLISYTRDVNAGNDINVDITLTTTNLANCPSDPVSINETVEKRRPDVVASFDLSSGTVQLPDATVTITNTSTDDPGFTYLWDFGDGTTSTDRDPGSHTYTDFGSYVITLTITDEFCESEVFQGIQVTPADPVIDFEADTLQGCVPLTVRFTNTSQSAVSGDFLWEFGDGSISRDDNTEHTYFDGGSYTVRLRGTNIVGTTLENEKVDYINALTRPLADFLTSTRVVYIPDQEVVFRNLSENATEYFWDFGDGDTSTLFEPSHAYMEEGTYDITLVAINELGCVDTLFRQAEVEAVIGGETDSPNAFTPNLSGPNGGVDTGGLNVNSVNDVFLPKLEGVVRYRMFIYNKWGQLLFKTEDQNIGWDGYFKGRLAPAGVYIYKLEVKYSDGREEVKAGDVTLIR